MANRIQETGFSPARFVTSTSRYADSRVIYYGDQNKITFSTYKKRTFPIAQSDTYTLINGSYEFRPDLLAFDIYGSTDFWWVLLEANNIKDIFDFKAGLNIRIPGNVFGSL